VLIVLSILLPPVEANVSLCGHNIGTRLSMKGYKQAFQHAGSALSTWVTCDTVTLYGVT